MPFALLWLAILVPLIAIDFIWLRFVVQPAFIATLGPVLRDQPGLLAALAFYLLYSAGLAYFAGLPALAGGGLLIAAREAAVLGLVAYGTYELTNMATLNGWTWNLVALDMAGGVVNSALAALAGVLILRAFGYGQS